MTTKNKSIKEAALAIIREGKGGETVGTLHAKLRERFTEEELGYGFKASFLKVLRIVKSLAKAGRLVTKEESHCDATAPVRVVGETFLVATWGKD